MPQPGDPKPGKTNFWQALKNFGSNMRNTYKTDYAASNPRAGKATQQQAKPGADPWAERWKQQNPQQQGQKSSWAEQMQNVYNPKKNPALMDPRINSQAAIEQGKKAGYTPVVVDSYYGQAKPAENKANNAWAARYQQYWESQFKPFAPDNYKAWAATGQRYRAQATADWVSETRRNRAWANRLTGQAAEYWSRPTEPLQAPTYTEPVGSGGYGGYDYGGYGGGGGGGGYTYTPDPGQWYANMTQWNINNPQPG